MFSLQILIGGGFRIINRKQVGYLRVAQVPQWVQAKALLGYQGGEDPRQKIDLVDAFEGFF